jgi:hypothetical protein
MHRLSLEQDQKRQNGTGKSRPCLAASCHSRAAVRQNNG